MVILECVISFCYTMRKNIYFAFICDFSNLPISHNSIEICTYCVSRDETTLIIGIFEFYLCAVFNFREKNGTS